MTTIDSQTNLSQALATLFASKARVAVLRVFVIDPSRAYYQRQIEAATDMPLRAVQREVERLASIDLLFTHREGNRVYYQIDVEHPLYPELRGMTLKSLSPLEALRADVAADAAVRVACLHAKGQEVLIVGRPGQTPAPITQETLTVVTMKSREFLDRLEQDPAELSGFLGEGLDLLGRRDDVIWRRIEAAGFDVMRGKGVA